MDNIATVLCSVEAVRCISTGYILRFTYIFKGLVVISHKTYYVKISHSPEAAIFDLSTASEMPVKFQSDTIIQIINLVASRLHEILR